MPLVASLLLVVWPGATSSFIAPSSDALCSVRSVLVPSETETMGCTEPLMRDAQGYPTDARLAHARDDDCDGLGGRTPG